ncbi:mitofilin family membrane protein [Marinicaulis aureus]|uniref:Mitofilin family membrane protein n=1 Tax=Hyphococcus aureus TaxID=2666033 RepID=A0ABW1KUJ2_9PROT
MTQNGDAQDKKDEDSLPEVEAELVSKTPPVEDAFEDDAPADQAPPDAHESNPGDGDGDNGGKRKSTLTPGVMLFLAFVVVALIAFAVWRVQMKPVSDGAAVTAPPVEETAPAISEAQDDSTVASEPETESEAAPEADTPETPQQKIENLAADDLAPEPFEEAAGETGEQSGGFLPPVTEAGGSKISNSVEEGAKEAMRQFGEAEAVQDKNPPTDEAAEAVATDDAEVAGDEAQEDLSVAPVSEPSEDVAHEAETDADTEVAVSPETSAEDEAVAMQSEMESMRAAFEEERAELAAALESARRINTDQNDELQDMLETLQLANAREEALKQEIATMRSEMEKLRREGATLSRQHMKASYALAALSRAVDQGAPFTEELAVLAEFEPSATAALETHAQTGVKSDVQLRENFDAAARRALAAAGQAEAGGGLSGIMARAKSLISVRPAVPMDGDDPGAILSRAENALEQGEIGFALLQLEDLPLPAQEAMAGWIANARARAEAQAAIARLTVQLSGDAE